MAQFFDYRIEGGARGETLVAAWSSKKQLFAVATDSNSVQLYNEEVSERR